MSDITPNQRFAIEVIEEYSPFEFNGNTKEEAAAFISKHSKAYADALLEIEIDSYTSELKREQFC